MLTAAGRIAMETSFGAEDADGRRRAASSLPSPQAATIANGKAMSRVSNPRRAVIAGLAGAADCGSMRVFVRPGISFFMLLIGTGRFVLASQRDPRRMRPDPCACINRDD